jgi:hypothetical protein
LNPSTIEFERASVLERIEVLREELRTIRKQHIPHELLIEKWQAVLDEISELRKKLGNE